METFNHSNLENIKYIFEKKTGITLKSTNKSVHFSVKRIVFIAALLTCFFALGCYALAATLDISNIFKDFFRVRQDSPLSAEQHAYIDDRIAAIGESVTQGDISVTVTGAITDGSMAYISIDITAPAGQNIEDLPLAFDAQFKKLRLEGQENDSISSVSTSCIPLDDNDGKVNTASMLIQYNIYQPLGSHFSFADGKARTLLLQNLFYHETDYPYTLCIVAEGTWTFEIIFTPVNDQETELLSTPISASCEQISGNAVTASIFSIRMKGLSVSVYYTLDSNTIQEASDFGILKFEMKDGQIICAYPDKAGQTARTENGHLIPDTFCHYCTYEFEAPVNYEDLAALYIGDTVIDITG